MNNEPRISYDVRKAAREGRYKSPPRDFIKDLDWSEFPRKCECTEFWVQDPYNEIEMEAQGGLKKIRTHDLRILALYDFIYKNHERISQRSLRKAS